MRTFLIVFCAIILALLGILVIVTSGFAILFGGTVGAYVQIIIGIALIAGAITLGIKVRRR